MRHKTYRGKTSMTESQHDMMLAMADIPTHNIKGLDKIIYQSFNTSMFKKKENLKGTVVKKIVDTINHTKEQDDKISAKRLKKNKKKQAKKNKKNKKKTKKKTSQEHIDELNVGFQTAMDEHTKEIYRKLEIYKQQKLKGVGPRVCVVE